MAIFRFEDIGPDLPLLPLAARRALDVAGRRLSLKAWQGLTLEVRALLVGLGAQASIDPGAVRAAIAGAEPPASEIPADDERRLEQPPATLAGRLGPERWAAFGPLERFALHHLAGKNKPARLDEALAEIAPSPPSHSDLSHLDAHGHARMVDVGDKAITRRRAVASARVAMKPETARLCGPNAPKGDVLAVARVAGIMAAKRTPELIPLCHGIALTKVTVSFEIDEARGLVRVTAAAEAEDRTGVEMEAMTAAGVAALTIYDMLKGVEKGIAIEELVLVEKSGGRSGHYRRGAAP